MNVDRLFQWVGGVYPTPLQRIDSLSTESCAFWVKRDDLTHPLYGGNKVRKLERILAEAHARKAKRLFTIGAVGSHHVLTTAIFGARAGFEVEALLVPQPRTEHVTENLRADLGQGATLRSAGSFLSAALWSIGHRLMNLGKNVFYIPVGGSSVAGALAYVDAALELAEQIRAGVMPEPDLLVVTLGSGGTTAGLAAGLARAGLRTRVIAVCVSEPAFIVRCAAALLTWRCMRDARSGRADREGLRAEDSRAEENRGGARKANWRFEGRYLGDGYGKKTTWGARAAECAAEVGLTLDPTYTAKTFAAALDLLPDRAPTFSRVEPPARTVLYWHTLSSAPMEPLLAHAPSEADVSPDLTRLLQ